jgi:hypothetical protein
VQTAIRIALSALVLSLCVDGLAARTPLALENDCSCSTRPAQRCRASTPSWSSPSRTHGFLILSRAGRLLHTLPSAEFAALAMAYDRNGVLYTVDTTPTTVFRDHVPFASLPADRSVGRVAVDSRGNVYVTSALSLEGPSPKVFRVDPSGQVSVFADATQGLDNPLGSRSIVTTTCSWPTWRPSSSRASSSSSTRPGRVGVCERYLADHQEHDV